MQKLANEIDEETGDAITWYYVFSEEWEGFNKINSTEEAFKLIRKFIKRF